MNLRKLLKLVVLVILSSFGPSLTACQYDSILYNGDISINAAPVVTSASLEGTKLTLVGTSLDQVTSASLVQGANSTPLAFSSQGATQLTANLVSNFSIAVSAAVQLILQTQSASAATPVTLSINLSGAQLTNFSSTGIVDHATSQTLTLNGLGRVGINQPNPAVGLDVSGETDAVRLPSGSTAQRPPAPANGDIRYNSTSNMVESYVNGSWQTLVSAGQSAGLNLSTTSTLNTGTVAINSLSDFYSPASPAVANTTVFGTQSVLSDQNASVDMSNASIVGLSGEALRASAQNLGSISAMSAQIFSNTNATTTNATALNAAYVQFGAGSTTNATGVASSLTAAAGSTIQNAFGVSSSVTTSGTLTNAYGVYVGTVQGTNHWAVYTADSSPSYFGGNVGIGTYPGSYALYVNGQTAFTGAMGIGTTPIPGYEIAVAGAAGLSSGTAWTNISDERLKDVHGPYEYGLKEIVQLRPIRFNYKADNPMHFGTDQPMVGFSAQEVQAVIPDAVHTRADGYLELNVDPIHWAAINAIRELNTQLSDRNERIETENRRLRDQLSSLSERLARLERLQAGSSR